MLKFFHFRYLPYSFLVMGLFFSLGVMSASAAVNTYTVTGGDVGALPNVGEASVTLNTITITEDGVGDDFSTGTFEDIQVSLNQTNYSNVVFDTSVAAGSITIGGTCGGTTPATSVTYTGTAIATVRVTDANPLCGAGQSITIAGLKIGTKFVQAAPGAFNLISVDNATTSVGSAVLSSSNINLGSAVGALTGVSMTPSSLANSQLVTYTVAFTASSVSGSPAIGNSGKILITFPAGYDLTSFSGNAGSLSGLDGTWTGSVSGSVLTLTQSGGTGTTGGAKSFTLTNIRNPATTGTTGSFTITTQNSTPSNMQTAGPAGVAIVTSSPSSDTATFNAISGIAITDEPTGGVRVSWTDPSDDSTTDISILKGTAPSPVDGAVYATVALGTGYYIDTNVSAGDIVTYQLRGTDGPHTGDLSNAVTFTVGSGTSTSTSTDTTDNSTGTTDTSTDTTDTTDTTTTDTSTTSSTASDMFSDEIPAWAETAITVLANAGVVEGNPDGTFNAAGYLNRAEAATLLWRVLMMGDPSGADIAPFTDVSLSTWFTDYVSSLKDLGLVAGNPDGTFEPAESINRAEFLKLAMNVYAYLNPDVSMTMSAMTTAYQDLDTSAWYAETVSLATEWGFVEGSACTGGMCFSAGDMITRAEASQILYNMFGSSL